MGNRWSDREIEETLRRAVDSSVPDVFDEIMEKETAPLLNADGVIPLVTPRRRSRLPVALCACAAMLACALGLSYFHTAAILSVGTEPGVELSLNYFRRVLKADGVGESGETVLAGLDLRHGSMEDALEQVTASMARSGLLEGAEEIPVAVDGGSWKYNRALLSEARAALEEELREQGSDVPVRPVPEEERPEVLPPDQSQQPEPEPAVPVQSAAPEPQHTPAPPPPAPIGETAAWDRVLTHAGCSREAIRDPSCEYEEEDGRACYEVKFEWEDREYQYLLDRYTGEILDVDVDD